MFDKKHAGQLTLICAYIVALVVAFVKVMTSITASGASVAAYAVAAVGYIVLAAGILMFTIFNEGLFFSQEAITAIFVAGLLVLPVAGIVLYGATGLGYMIAAIVLLVATVAVFVTVLLKSLVFDLFQPIALNTLNMIVLILGAVVSMVASLLLLIFGMEGLSMVNSISLLVLMAIGALWARYQGFGKFSNVNGEPQILFEGKKDGYSAYRIPSLTVLDKDVLNSQLGTDFKQDILLALVEGRKNSAHDTGVVDMLGKISTDGGNTWSETRTFFSFKDEIGKYGNPTVVLDKATGILNIVHMSATKSTGFNYNTYNIQGKIKSDLTFEWSEPINISLPKDKNAKKGGSDGVRSDTLMVGPGKGVQIDRGEYAGRLIVPASNNGNSFVMYSDDHGLSWTRGANAGSGNECEAAVLNDGEVVMVVRANTGCSNYHPRQFQRLSYSSDGGQSWYETTKNTSLRTPICMSSVYVSEKGELLLGYPDSFHTRVNLSVAKSKDGGQTFDTKLIYQGASGYCCIDGDKEGNVYVLAEIGKVNYSDCIMFAKLDV